ncbi:helix-turn-helix transcriptional regulator [Kumtagia ephedrae]|uniref:HTH luxR-type domain-containing protein n=1 Tax=Kumtagia ephedrae TaxID=2116701 RepID=A0A2P7S111_9HYPH|nr:helix-turn-helix transcriptional regulator [Mesorhizobium ephedrae]PSJ56132.1 hypothetical protein C7I84_21405 [Mesorhizobium ephedrae]
MRGQTAIDEFRRALDAAVLDASSWRVVCDKLAAVFGGIGTCFVPIEPELRGPWLVHSESLTGIIQEYVGAGWHKRDFRQTCVSIARERGYATDLDIASPETLRSHPYYADLMRRHGLGIFIGIHLRIGERDWIAAVQRPLKSDPPDAALLAPVQILRNDLMQAARSAYLVGMPKLETWVANFDEDDRGSILLAKNGGVIKINAAAELLLARVGTHTGGVVTLREARSDKDLQYLISAGCNLQLGQAMPPPLVVAAGPGEVLVFEMFRAPAALRHFSLDVAGLMMIRRGQVPIQNVADQLSKRFGLSFAEIRVARGVGDGLRPRDMAETFGLAEGTVRQQLKAVLRKSGVHSQSQLAALVSRLG